LRTGSRGDEVIKLQTYLKKAGFFDHHTATGYFGSVTDQAVRKFQRARGLKVDGIAGNQTITAINKEITNTSTSAEPKANTPKTNQNQQTSNNTNTTPTVNHAVNNT
ncbi:peptidoglycan-binding domain-containing protein, partial [Pseudomonas sp. 2995-1]|uniref:peptidoglycan-binding domain-containing protein n=1 Tax=Pseudomonas sp. 2995-1 TaxID=1712679 RepID=UPI00117A3C4D